MSVEGGAKAGFVAQDEKAYAYLKDKPKSPKGAGLRFVTFREDDRFRFKLVDADEAIVLTSVAFADPQACGRAIGAIKKAAVAGIALPTATRGDGGFDLSLDDGSTVASGDDADRFSQAMEALALLAA